jgi:competence CoiA-like predicted nuclease
MPLKGKNRETNEEALSFEQFDVLRTWQRAGLLVCPFCDEPIVSVREHQREGDWVQAYVRHKGDCATTLAHHPESAEHLAAKRWIKEHAAELYSYEDALGDCEVRMPEINRIADVCFTLATGERMVHEAQLAAISVDDLEARTNDYQSIGYSIIWHFGKAADTQTNKQWAFRRLGGCEVLSFDEHVVGL